MMRKKLRSMKRVLELSSAWKSGEARGEFCRDPRQQALVA
uniref:Uncharacterized protein n=1 Tax=Rhizophora mucronata TaxID=61149 RepID=A0A2P2N713_RHIMU